MLSTRYGLGPMTQSTPWGARLVTTTTRLAAEDLAKVLRSKILGTYVTYCKRKEQGAMS
jgi:hypothetical protein